MPARLRDLLAALALVMISCAEVQNPQIELEAGLTRQQVMDVLGEPDEITELVMPDRPFFGPQEALTGLVPDGGVVEEWQYVLGDGVMYLWFYGEPSRGMDGRRLMGTATVAKDAVY